MKGRKQREDEVKKERLESGLGWSGKKGIRQAGGETGCELEVNLVQRLENGDGLGVWNSVVDRGGYEGSHQGGHGNGAPRGYQGTVPKLGIFLSIFSEFPVFLLKGVTS